MSSRERIATTTKTRGILGDLFAHAIASAGISQAEAGRLLGSVASAVSQWASGDREVPVEALLYAARRLPPAEQARLVERGVEGLLGIRVRVELPVELIEAGDPVALVGDLAERSSRSIRSVLDTISDGRIEAHEAERLVADAASLEQLASRMRALARGPSLTDVVDARVRSGR